MTPDPTALLDALVKRFEPDDRAPLVLVPGERLVPATSCADPGWLDEQLRLRGQRWHTDDRRVLATLWWYSASSWIIGPTLTSLALGEHVLSADPADLAVHWLPDSRITGATATRVLPSDGDVPSVGLAGASLRRLYDHVIPTLASRAAIPPRPLWAIAADAIATRLLFIGRSIGDLERVAALLDPIIDALGPPLPRPTYHGTGPSLETRRLSCCLLYLAPGQSTCSFCPKLRARASTVG